MHSLGPFARTKLQRMLFQWILKKINLRRIIVTTDLLADMLRKELPDVDIVVARLSAELPKPVLPEDLISFRENKMQGTTFKYHVGYTGYLDNYGLRGTDIICKVAEKMPEAAFHIVGGEDKIVEHWQQFSAQYNQYKNIFFYGYRNPEEMPYFLGCFDVVLAPLQFRPLQRAPTGQNMSPLKLPQYMGYEKAIVASDIPSHQEVLENNHNAILVPCDDVFGWAEAINKLLQDQKLRSIMGKNAKSAYYKEFTPQLRVERILKNIAP